MRSVALAAVACAVVGAGLLALRSTGRETGDVVTDGGPAPVAVVAGETDSPFAVSSGTPPDVAVDVRTDTDADTGAAAASRKNVAAGPVPVAGAVDVQALGRVPMSDGEFDALVVRLNRDPALLDALIQELRGETDASRIERLSLLLGDLGHPDVTALAVELAYASDPALRAAGLDLLKRTGDGELDERDAVVSGLLSSETDPGILMSALGALSRPGNVDDSTRASMATQVALLADHADPAVRRGSIDIVSRWTRDGSDTPLLLDGLRDDDESVRRGAAYAFVGHEAVDEDVRRELLLVVEDRSESRAIRSAALLALKRAGPHDEESRRELDRLQAGLDRRPSGERSN